MRGRREGTRSWSSVVDWSLAIVETVLRYGGANWLLRYDARWLGHWMLLYWMDKVVECVQRVMQSPRVMYRGALPINSLQGTGIISGISHLC
jgi:hypothetical protein